MSAAATLTKQFSEHVADERQSAEEEYHNCVRYAADGDGPGLEDLSALCQVVGRSG